LRVCVPKEVAAGERRVALVPSVVSKLAEGGFEVVVETSAGAAAGFPDPEYEEAGAKIASSAAELLGGAAAVLKVREPGQGPAGDELEQIPGGALLIGFLQPLTNADLVKRLVDRRVTSFAMEAIPRTTRAQSMDALSSQAVTAGYRGTLAAAESLGKFFPMLITAAGTAAPARVLVLGAGVAGLQAIATARRLGAVVEAYDVRPAVKEEVESLGAKFVQIPVQQEGEGSGSGEYAKELPEETQRKQRELLADRVAKADCVITTAAVPGRPAPKLVTEDMVSAMQPGSVIVDLAAETGGNCALTEPDQIVERHGVKIDGRLNLPSRMPYHASLLYANNVANLLTHLAPEGELNLDFEDEITAGACITHDGRIVNERVREQNETTGPQADRPVSEGTTA
jgi:NAD(P) transhydrogenase subunit alpha